ncbi:YggT family protein [Rhabdothermincola sediminis]|uniref:YggT family protein n=1 Tax=Rhabdothermincola sediminis TaxID=2751370 RepID=UPI001AA0432C|nr:YggT family protein [Rhabdothermincola sediminis]
MGIICYLLQVYLLVLLVRILLSWFPISDGGALGSLYRVLEAVTEPVLAPLRGVLPPVRLGAVALDLSPLVVFFGIQILLAFLCR